MLPAASTRSSKTKKTDSKKGQEIDKFIESTKRFIEDKTKIELREDSRCVENSIIVTDEDINDFVEVVTGSRLRDNILSSTKLDSTMTDVSHSSQAPYQSSSAQGRFNSQGAAAVGDGSGV